MGQARPCRGGPSSPSLCTAPRKGMSNHFIVFTLACVVGFYVITNVTFAAHPLMSLTGTNIRDHRRPARLG